MLDALEPSHNWYCTGLENRRPNGLVGSSPTGSALCRTTTYGTRSQGPGRGAALTVDIGWHQSLSLGIDISRALLIDPQLALSSKFKAATNALQGTGSP